MVSTVRILVIFSASVVFSAKATEKGIKDVIGFPENEENPLLVNKQNRSPVFIPAKCPENELFYPGDQVDDWICDCRAGYLFHPGTDKCWPALQRGPCPSGQYLILPKTSMIPICVPNPCKEDVMVLWENKCAKLGSSVCGVTFPAKVLWVNVTTLEPDCVNVTVDNRSSFDAITECPPGCRRSIQNKCTPPKV